LITGAADIKADWLDGKKAVGVTAGASAPEVLVQGVVQHLQAAGGKTDTGLTAKLYERQLGSF